MTAPPELFRSKHEAMRFLAADARDRCGFQGGGFRDFIRLFWPLATIDHATFDEDFGWFADGMAEALTAVAARSIGNLVINAAPGTGKSTIVSVLFPTWLWTLDSKHTFMSTSFADPLINRWADLRATVMTSELYTMAWPRVQYKPGGAKKQQSNKQGGAIYGLALGGPGTGTHVRTQICDDPHNANDKDSKLKKATVHSRWHGGLATRTFDPVDFRRVVNQQRITSDDLAGSCLEMGYEHLCLPLRYHPKAIWDRGCKIAWKDPRTRPGEPIKSEAWAAAREKTLTSPQDRSAQFDQNPTPDAGGIIEKSWIRRANATALGDLDQLQWFQSWDFGFKGKDASHSRVVGGLFAVRGASSPTVFWVRNTPPLHLSYAQSKALVRFVNGVELADADRELLPAGMREDPLWLRARLKLVEDKANGPAIMSDLANDVQGFEPVEPKGDKAERLIRHSANIRGGCLVVLNENAYADMIVDELVGFPLSTYDDLVDIATQALDAAFHPLARRPEQLQQMLINLERMSEIEFG